MSNMSNKEKLIMVRDRQYKNAENKNTKEHTLDVGDHVFVDQPKKINGQQNMSMIYTLSTR